MCHLLKGHQHTLETINATVSHEMRNPINSILAQVIKLEELTESLEQIIDVGEYRTVNEIKTAMKKLNWGY